MEKVVEPMTSGSISKRMIFLLYEKVLERLL